MKRRTRKSANTTNWNEISMCIGFTVVSLMVLGGMAFVQVSNYMHWASQFHS